MYHVYKCVYLSVCMYAVYVYVCVCMMHMYKSIRIKVKYTFTRNKCHKKEVLHGVDHSINDFFLTIA